MGFRAFVERQARALGVRGATRNLADGRVEILALGEPAALEALEVMVKKGPSHSSVAELKATPGERLSASPAWLETASGFSIFEDGELPWH